MADVAGVQQEVWRRRQRVDFIYGCLESSHNIRIGRLVEAHVAVADLNKAEVSTSAGMLGNIFRESPGNGNAAAHGPYQTRPGPGHAFQKSAAVDNVVVEILEFLMDKILVVIRHFASVVCRSVWITGGPRFYSLQNKTRCVQDEQR